MSLLRKVAAVLVALIMIVLALATATSGAVAAPARQATVSATDDVGVQSYCTSAREVPGSVPYGHFGGDATTACRKCEETAKALRAKGRISAYACYYNTSTGEAFAYVVWTCPWWLTPPCP